MKKLLVSGILSLSLVLNYFVITTNASKDKKIQQLEAEKEQLQIDLKKERSLPFNKRLHEVQDALKATREGLLKTQEHFERLQVDLLNREKSK